MQEAICSHAYLHGKSFSVSKYFKGKTIEPCMIAQISFMMTAPANSYTNVTVSEAKNMIDFTKPKKKVVLSSRLCVRSGF